MATKAKTPTTNPKRSTQKLKNSLNEVIKSPSHGIIGDAKPRKPKISPKEEPKEEPKPELKKPEPKKIVYGKDELRIGSLISVMHRKPNKKGHKSSRLFKVTSIKDGIAIAQSTEEASRDKIFIIQKLQYSETRKANQVKFAGFGRDAKRNEVGFVIKP